MTVNSIKNFKIKKINFHNINLDTLVINFLITLFIASIFFIVSSINQNHHQKIVIFDRDAVFQDYLKNIKSVVNNSKDKNISQSFLDNKNQFFVEHMISDLYAYQKKNHVIILKRDSLTAPNVFLHSSIDITPQIENQLKKQDAI